MASDENNYILTLFRRYSCIYLFTYIVYCIYPAHEMKVAVIIRVCGTAELGKNFSWNTEFWQFSDRTTEFFIPAGGRFSRIRYIEYRILIICTDLQNSSPVILQKGSGHFLIFPTSSIYPSYEGGAEFRLKITGTSDFS